MQVIYLGEYVPKEFNIKVVEGIRPTGKDAIFMYKHIKSLGVNKGTFKMQVEYKGYGSISTIKFKAI